MFRDLLRFPARYSIKSSLWKSPKRMTEAAKLNSKPYIPLSLLPTLKQVKPNNKR